MGPGNYDFTSFTDEVIKKVTSLRGPYDLFSADRNKPYKDWSPCCPSMWFYLFLIEFCLFLIENKKVLLRDRKRPTARGVALFALVSGGGGLPLSRQRVSLSYLGGGGTPCPVRGGTPVLSGRVPPVLSGGGGDTSCPVLAGVPPPHAGPGSVTGLWDIPQKGLGTRG